MNQSSCQCARRALAGAGSVRGTGLRRRGRRFGLNLADICRVYLRHVRDGVIGRRFDSASGTLEAALAGGAPTPTLPHKGGGGDSGTVRRKLDPLTCLRGFTATWHGLNSPSPLVGEGRRGGEIGLTGSMPVKPIPAAQPPPEMLLHFIRQRRPCLTRRRTGRSRAAHRSSPARSVRHRCCRTRSHRGRAPTRARPAAR